MEVRSRRIGGATYQVPVEVRAKRRTALAMSFEAVMLSKHAVRSRPNSTFLTTSVKLSFVDFL